MYGNNGRRSVSAKRLSNRKRMKLANLAIEHANNVRMVLLAVLAQSGGEVTVTAGTLRQVGLNYANLDYAIVDGVNENESVVRLVEGKANDGEQTIPAVGVGDAAVGSAGTDAASGSNGADSGIDGDAGEPAAHIVGIDIAGSGPDFTVVRVDEPGTDDADAGSR